MLVLWLFVWVCYNAPWHGFFWNQWGISLAVCLLIDIMDGRYVVRWERSWRQHRRNVVYRQNDSNLYDQDDSSSPW